MFKKNILLTLVFLSIVFCSWEIVDDSKSKSNDNSRQGMKSIRGNGSFSISSYEGEVDSKTISIEPSLSYFLTNEIEVLLSIDYLNRNYEYDDYTYESLSFGIGGAYYINSNLYLMGGILGEVAFDDNDFDDDNFIQCGMGMLFSLSKEVFVDIGANAKIGIGEFNEERVILGPSFGIKCIF